MMYSQTEAADWGLVERLGQLSQKRGLSYATLALAWMLDKPFVTAPIIGATKPGQLEDAMAALSVRLSAEEIAFLEEPYVPHPVLGFK